MMLIPKRLATVVILAAVLGPPPVLAQAAGDPHIHWESDDVDEDPARLLYVWMGDVDGDPETGQLGPGDDSDFLAVYDVDPESAVGTLLRTRNPRTNTLEPTGHALPFVPRVMHDGSVLFNTFGCGLYRITGMDGGSPTVENVYTFAMPEVVPDGACGVPVYTGRYWVMPVGAAPALVSLDVEDPARPRRVSALDPGAHRLIVGAENGGEDRMLMARLDPATGELTWDETLRERNGFPGIDFRRISWPHGETGMAFGHAALFDRREP